MDRNDIITALTVIKKVCMEAEDCYMCPLRENYQDCKLDNINVAPKDWKLATVGDDYWRAFE